MIAVFAGLDGATVREQAAALADSRDPSGQSTSRIDGRTATISEIIAQVASGGFFGAGRVVIVTDILSRTKRGGKRAASDSTDEAGLDLAPVIKTVRDENLLILVDTSVVSLPAALAKALPADAQVSLHEPPRGQALIRWIMERAAAEGGAIGQAVAREFAARAYPQTWSATPNNPRYDRPPDTVLLGNEIAKLVNAAHPGPVSSAIVRDMAISGDDDQIFRFSDAAGQGNLSQALPELARLLDAGEDATRLGAQLGQQAELGAVIDAAESRDPAQMARDLGLGAPGRVSALVAARRRGLRPGRLAVAAALQADRATKRGQLRSPTDALYGILADLADPDTP